MKQFLLSITLICCLSQSAFAQFPYGTTGLLHAPSADMQAYKTVMLGGSYLHKNATPPKWYYETYNYYVNATLFPWLEVAYTMTLFKGYALKGLKNTGSKYTNQDRHFDVRLRLWKEGWWREWTPQIVLGADDPGTSAGSTSIEKVGEKGNGYWNRYYLAMTKHLYWGGNWGLHVGYAYNKREDNPINRPTAGVNYQPEFLPSLNLIADYDALACSVGFNYALFKDAINLTAELYKCQYPSFGLYFKIHLK
ncbi:MAG: YjbH domain-containing protein [Bacteroidales bacterium]|nr:YjbH domain-containing protein [Bacteroidales bacterium]